MPEDRFDKNLKSENDRHAFVLSLFSIVGLSITLAMAIVAIIGQRYPIGFTLLFASLAFLVGFISQRKTKSIKLASFITASSLYALMIYLVYSGGIENTGPIWMFIVPSVSLFIRGLKQGMIDIAVFLLIYSTIMFIPEAPIYNESYTAEFKVRLTLSFLTVTFLSACYEYSREKSIQHMQALGREYQQLALHDHLTQLPNRRSALQKLEFERPSSIRNNSNLSIILCDVDHFKSINDRFGHDGGDHVLVELSKLFTDLIRAQDMVARWGGEEFLFILPSTKLQSAIKVSQKIHDQLKEINFCFDGKETKITVSMGIAELENDFNIDQAINKADQRLYQAKENGRNQTCWEPTPNDRT